MGGYLRELDFGTRSPGNVTEEHFVAVCPGVAQAITQYEAAYVALKNHLAIRGLSVGQVGAIGFQPIPELICQPAISNTGNFPASCPAQGMGHSAGCARSAEDADWNGNEVAGSPPGFIYKDNRYGNRRWIS